MWMVTHTHLVYFGISREAVAAASVDDREYRGHFVGDTNIFDPKDLKAGQTYFWRVDAVSVGRLKKGEVWSFSVDGSETSVVDNSP